MTDEHKIARFDVSHELLLAALGLPAGDMTHAERIFPDGSTLITVAVDAWRLQELERLLDAANRNAGQPLDRNAAVDELFALGIQGGWLRLSAGKSLLDAS